MNLAWTASKIRAFENLATSGSRYKCGGSCAFLKVGKTWGLKFYQNVDDRDFAFYQQRRAAKHKLGPRVGNRFKIQHPKCRYLLNPWWKEICIEDNPSVYVYVTEAALIRRSSEQRVLDLEDALDKIGIYTEDLAIDNNVGFLYGGKLVCIDFDYWSTDIS